MVLRVRRFFSWSLEKKLLRICFSWGVHVRETNSPSSPCSVCTSWLLFMSCREGPCWSRVLDQRGMEGWVLTGKGKVKEQNSLQPPVFVLIHVTVFSVSSARKLSPQECWNSPHPGFTALERTGSKLQGDVRTAGVKGHHSCNL